MVSGKINGVFHIPGCPDSTAGLVYQLVFDMGVGVDFLDRLWSCWLG